MRGLASQEGPADFRAKWHRSRFQHLLPIPWPVMPGALHLVTSFNLGLRLLASLYSTLGIPLSQELRDLIPLLHNTLLMIDPSSSLELRKTPGLRNGRPIFLFCAN